MHFSIIFSCCPTTTLIYIYGQPVEIFNWMVGSIPEITQQFGILGLPLQTESRHSKSIPCSRRLPTIWQFNYSKFQATPSSNRLPFLGRDESEGNVVQRTTVSLYNFPRRDPRPVPFVSNLYSQRGDTQSRSSTAHVQVTRWLVALLTSVVSKLLIHTTTLLLLLLSFLADAPSNSDTVAHVPAAGIPPWNTRTPPRTLAKHIPHTLHFASTAPPLGLFLFFVFASQTTFNYSRNSEMRFRNFATTMTRNPSEMGGRLPE